KMQKGRRSDPFRSVHSRGSKLQFRSLNQTSSIHLNATCMPIMPSKSPRSGHICAFDMKHLSKMINETHAKRNHVHHSFGMCIITPLSFGGGGHDDAGSRDLRE